LDGLIEDLPTLREHIRCNRGDAESLHKLGVMLATRGEYRRSFICHREATVCCPENAKYLYHAGSAALALGQTGEADWRLDRALSIDPNYTEAWQTRGQLYVDHFKLPDEALRSYARATELAPEELLNYQFAARCALMGHGQGAALARLRDAMSTGLDPLNVERGFALGLMDEGQYEDAGRVLHDILRRQPDDQASMRVLADLYAGLRDWGAAQSLFERAMASTCRDWGISTRRGSFIVLTRWARPVRIP
jgi:Tfp pilus assembly protein PilF